MTDLPAPKTGRAARPTDAGSVQRRSQLEQWQKQLSDQTIAEIIRYRDIRNISNDELRRRLSFLGWDLTKDSLASVLSAKRKSMPISDILLFAQALNVPPIALVFPLLTNAPSSLWPGAEPRGFAYRDAMWFNGTNAHWGGAYLANPESADVDEYLDVGDMVSRFREIDKIVFSAFYLNASLINVDLTDGRRETSVDNLREYLNEIAMIRRFLITAHRGILMPKLHPSLQFLDERDFVMPDLPIREFTEMTSEESVFLGAPKNAD